MANFLTRIFGSRNQRMLRQYTKTANKITALEEGLKRLDDAALRAKTAEFQTRYSDGETLDDLLPEVFAVARSGCASAGNATFRRPVDRWHGTA